MYIHTYGAFFRWNQIDLVTVVLGWTGVFLSNRAVNFNVLRIIRVVRLMRAARVVISIPEFYILVAGSQLHWSREGEEGMVKIVQYIYSIYMDVDFEWFECILSKLPNSKLSYWFSKCLAHQTLCNLSILNLSWFGSWSFLMGSLSQTCENDTWNLNSGIAVALNSFFRCENYQLEQGSSLFLIFWNAQVSGLTSSFKAILFGSVMLLSVARLCTTEVDQFLGSFESFSTTSQFEAMWLENIANVGPSDLRKFLGRFAVTVFILFFFFQFATAEIVSSMSHESMSLSL